MQGCKDARMQECKVARMESLSIGESETFNSLNLKLGGVEAGNRLYYVVSNLRGGLPGENFLVLVEYVGIHAQADAASQHLGPYLVVRTAAGQ